MTRAQERLATFVDWIVSSSQPCRAPMGGTIVYGAYAVFCPMALSLPPQPAFAPEHLPLWIPEQQAIPGLPPYTQEPPPGHGLRSARIRNLLWQWESRRFEGALLGLTDPGEPLQIVMGREAPGLDLTVYPVVFLPLFDLDAKSRAFIDRRLPLLCDLGGGLQVGGTYHPPPVPIA